MSAELDKDMPAYRTQSDLRTERREVYDRKIVLDRMRGLSLAECARLNGCSPTTVSKALRRHGVTEREGRIWSFCISVKRATLLGITEDEIAATGATKRWSDIWQSAVPLSERDWYQRYVLARV